MQQHTGQHVLSAAFISLFEMPTVSFHMGAESCTIDLDTKSADAEQVRRAEALANEVIAEDRRGGNQVRDGGRSACDGRAKNSSGGTRKIAAHRH